MDIIRINENSNTEPQKEIYEQIIRLEEGIFGSDSWDKNFIKDILKNDFDYLMVAKDLDKIIGYGVIRCLEDADILSLAVDPERRKRGVGRTLLKKLTECAKKAGSKRIFLEVRSHNYHARKMYELSGFENIGFRKGYYSDPYDDAIIMRYIC